MGVHVQQHVPQRWKVLVAGRLEGDRPWPGRPLTRRPLLEGVEVEVGEADVPSLDPLGVLEAAPPDLLSDCHRRAH
jgi:hypothetical protein